MKHSPIELLTPIIGTTTSIGSYMASFYAFSIPALQFLSLLMSVVAATLTTLHVIKKNQEK